MRRSGLLIVLLWAGCGFSPNLSRFPSCGEGDSCPAGSACLAEAHRCVPTCADGCTASDAGVDGGVDAGVDGGDDAGQQDGGLALRLAARALPPAVELRAYSERFVPTGGVPPYTFAIDGGVPGFTLAVDGALSAPAPPTPGTFPFSIAVQDDDTPRARVSADFTLEVRPLLRVASHDAQIEGRQGQAYSQPLFATGGAPPYVWSADAGALPPG